MCVSTLTHCRKPKFGRGMGATALTRVVTQGLTAKVTCEQNSKRGQGGSPLAIRGKVFQAERKAYTNLCAEIRLGKLSQETVLEQSKRVEEPCGRGAQKGGAGGAGHRPVSHWEGRKGFSFTLRELGNLQRLPSRRQPQTTWF